MEGSICSSHLLTGPYDGEADTGASFSGKDTKALTLGTSRQGTGLSQCDLDSQHYRGSFHSELTGTTEQGSDFISLQMCVAREEQTTDSLTFKSGNMAPHLK